MTPKLRLELRTSYQEADLNSYNVIADIPGEDPRASQSGGVASAHTSTRGMPPPARLTTQTARLPQPRRCACSKASGIHPRRTIRLALWSAEEVGFGGGRAYVSQHLAEQACARQRRGVFEQRPGNRCDLWLVYGQQRRRSQDLRRWLGQMKDLGLKKNTMESNFTSEDGVFDAAGIPAFTTIQDYVNYDARTRHTNADFFDAVSEKDLQQSAMVMAAFAYQAAMRNDIIPRRPAGSGRVARLPGLADARVRGPGRGGPGGQGAGPAGRGTPPQTR